jgi:hypothetical protein
MVSPERRDHARRGGKDLDLKRAVAPGFVVYTIAWPSVRVSAMSFGDRLGILGLIVAVLGIGLTILWPKKALGWACIVMAIAIGGWWAILEVHDNTHPEVVTVKTLPTITWPDPSPIEFGTPLSKKQLNATSSVDGAFVYSPTFNATLHTGTNTLSVTFTPINQDKYFSQTKTVALVVNPPKNRSSPIPYAYLAFPERKLDEQGGLSLGLHMMVRDYPTTGDARRGIVSLSSLQHVTAIAATPIYVSPIDDGWCSCIIGQVADVSEWNNDDGLRNRLGEITTTAGTHIIEFQTTTRNGLSTGVVILNIRDHDLDYEEWISGTVLASGEKNIFRVRETSSPKGPSIVDVNTIDVNVDKALLTKYGVPTGPLSADLLRSRCSYGSRYAVIFHGDGKTTTFTRHHDACGQ